MKRISLIFSLLGMVLIIVGISYMGLDWINQSKKIEKIVINEQIVKLKYGMMKKISFKIEPSTANNKNVFWESSDPTLVAVDDNGNILAISNTDGTAKITVGSSNGVSCSINVIVEKVENELNVESFNIKEKIMYIKYGEAKKIEYSLISDDIFNNMMIWNSSNPDLVTVDETGNVKVVSNEDGSAFVTATTLNNLSDSIVVNVSKVKEIIEVRNVKINNSKVSLKYGEKIKLNATIQPDNATDNIVIWKSSDTSLVTVDNDGNAIAVGNKNGIAIVTASSSNGKYANVKIEVEKRNIEIPIEKIKLDKEKIVLKYGEMANIDVTIEPSTATNGTLKWSSSNPNLVSVDNNGNIRVLKNVDGSSTITVITPENKTAYLQVLVQKINTIIDVNSIKINRLSSSIKYGEMIKLSTIIEPSNATNKLVFWESSNPDFVNIDNDGNINILDNKDGNVTITAISSNGKKDSIKLIVQKVNIPIEVSSIKIVQKSLNMKYGDVGNLTATIEPSTATDKSIKWFSSDTSLVSIDENGNIIAIGNRDGKTIITVESSNGKRDSIEVFVEKVDMSIGVDSIKINEKSLSLKYGEIGKLTTVLQPNNATNKSLTWESSDPNFVMVDREGNVIPMINKDGNVTITVKTSNEKSDNVQVNVQKANDTVEVDSVDILHDSITLIYGETTKINTTIKPMDATNKELTWHSSDESLISVENGKITAISNKDGIVTITVTTKNGKTDSVQVNVQKKVEVINVHSINISKDSISLKYGENMKLEVAIEPSSATDKEITWSSSDNNLVSVDEEGTIYAVGNKDGMATITATTKNGKTDSVQVNVQKVNTTIEVDSITLNKNSISLKYGETAKLNATIIPINATNKNIAWSSSNPDFVNVDNNGNVSIIKNESGTVEITATTSNQKKAKAIVNVTADVDLSLDTTNITLTVGDKYKINSILTPDENNITVSCKSDNVNVASVSKDCLVTAKWGGSATITATSSNGKTAKAKITVKNSNLILDNQFLSTSGTKIVRNGNEIVLKGFNLGVWLSRSVSFMPIKPYATSKEDLNSKGISCINNEAILQLLRKNKNVQAEAARQGNSVEKVVQDLSNMLYNNFITEQDFDIIAQTGANVIRLPFEFNLFLYEENGNYYYSETRAKDTFKRIDWAIEQCKKRGIYVIIDFHLAPGRQNSGGYCGEQKFFKTQDSTSEELANIKKYHSVVVTMWKKIADRYKNEAAVAGYDILNEPETTTNLLVDFYDKVYQGIREVDKKHIIFMEETCVFCGYNGVNNNYSVGGLPNPVTKNWSNVVYSTHDYFFKTINKSGDSVEDFATDASIIASRMNQKTNLTISKRNSYNIPYYIGEFSHLGTTKDNPHLKVWSDAMTLYSRNGLSFTPWTYKGHWERYYGLVFYGSTTDVSKDRKVDLENDSYERIKTVFSYTSTEAMKFNDSYYKIFLEQFGGRVAKKIQFLNASPITMNVNQSITVNYVISPNNAINKQVRWSSSESSIATVDSTTGKVLAKKKGTVKITASVVPLLLNDYNYKIVASYDVIVK